jgi:hypothetical protein
MLRRTLNSGIPVIVGFVLFLTVTPLFADEKPLDPSSIGRLLIGNTIHGIGEESGWFFAIYYKPDGTVSGMSSPFEGSAIIEYDEGLWKITHENGYCLKWNTFKQGRKRCMNMFRKDDQYEFKTKDGERQSTVKILEGNPDNL